MVYLSSYCSHAYVRWTLGAYYGLSLVDQSFPGDHVTGIFFFLVFFMSCILWDVCCWEYYGLAVGGGEVSP